MLPKAVANHTTATFIGESCWFKICSEATSDIPKSNTTDVLVQYVMLRRDLIDTWPTVSVVTQDCRASVNPRVLTQLFLIVFQKTVNEVDVDDIIMKQQLVPAISSRGFRHAGESLSVYIMEKLQKAN
ncbi:hypothetical protein ACFX2B_021939 [Malus domestica]